MIAPEPYRIRSVEPIRLAPRSERLAALERAGYNLFRLASRDVFIDLLTDSGTGAMSADQWASIHRADESYAGSASYERFVASVRETTGFPEVIPVHQGRAAERILFETLLRPGDVVASNTLFDTTRANIERVRARGLDLPEPSALRLSETTPHKGGVDIARLAFALEREPVRMVILTCTNNGLGGHAVSLGNVEAASRLCRARGVPLFIDGARFAENAGLLARTEERCRGRTARSIAAEIFSLADGCLVSAKKNGLAHIGGFLAVRDEALAGQLRQNLVVTEGFETYGGLAGRDLDAIAIGLRESLDEALLAHRLDQVEFLHQALRAAGVTLVSPAGGHAVYVDAGALFPQIPAAEFPGHAFACALYLEGGVRTCEVGTLMHGSGPELTRLAIPWRTYTASHLEYVARVAGEVAARRKSATGLRIVSAPPALRHFRAVLAPA